MSKRDETLLEFPCQFSLKAMGLADSDFDVLVVSLIRPHVDDLHEGAVKTKPSAAGKYISVTVTFEAISQDQLDNIYRAVSGHDRVLMAL